MTDDRFEDFLRGQARGFREAPEVPRDAMWEAIAAERRTRRPRRRPAWRYWGVGIAAALAIGIGIGRWSAPAGDVPTVAQAPSATGAAEVPVAMRLTTVEHLRRVEMFLTGFRADVRAGQPMAGGTGARDLLATTRLLLDSPVGDDLQIQTLLEDIELVLAQIASYTDRPHSGEFDLIDQSIEQRSVLFRLHSTVDVAAPGMPMQGAL